MGEAAVRAARAVHYVGAGTVELMLDRSGRFYFLEMNTRLQVEHPVTEAVFGVDLVLAQLAVARGEPVPWAQEALGSRGHAIEVRLYAEDPAQGFLPAIGKLIRYRPPVGPGIRCDSGVEEGDAITPFYDPLFAKLIAWGEDREQARRRLLAALDAWEIHGLVCNRDLLRAVVAHPAFAAGETHTGFLGEHFPQGAGVILPPSEAALIAAALGPLVQPSSGVAHTRGGSEGSDTASPWRALGAWRSLG
jgi:acetyl/propionyl-CoA carboxylase alpha subunit